MTNVHEEILEILCNFMERVQFYEKNEFKEYQ